MYRAQLLPELRAGPTGREVVLMHAVSRIVLDGYIDNIQVWWWCPGDILVAYRCGGGDTLVIYRCGVVSLWRGGVH